MATNKPMTFEKLEEMVTCIICMEVMESPQTFSCFHTICKKCKDKLKPVPRTTGFSCPSCRSVSEPQDIRSNFMMEQLIELYKESQREKRCAQCEREEPPQRCNDCKMDLCDACASSHCKVPYLKGHIVAPIDRSAREKVHIDTLIFCPLHKDKLVEFNCKNEERTLCINCKILEHNSHDTEIITDCLKRIVPWAQGKVEVLEKDIDKHREVIEKVDLAKKDLDEQLQKVQDELEAKKREFVRKIEDDHKKLEEQVRKMHAQEKEKLEQVRSNMTIKVDERRNMAEWVKISLKTAENASLMHVLQKDVRDRLVKVTEGPESQQPLPDIHYQVTSYKAKATLSGPNENILGQLAQTKK